MTHPTDTQAIDAALAALDQAGRIFSGPGKIIGYEMTALDYNTVKNALQAMKAPTEEMQDVVKFLLGEGTLDGCSFGEFPDNGEKYKRRYWWRTALRDAWNTRTQPPQSDLVEALEELSDIVQDVLDNNRDGNGIIDSFTLQTAKDALAKHKQETR